jgi:hypothetical protein
MLVAAKPGADFSVGCAGKRIGHLLFATHPILAFANGSMPVSPMGRFSAQRNFVHCSDNLCLAISHVPENGIFSARVGVGLCRMLDMDFVEYYFYALG